MRVVGLMWKSLRMIMKNSGMKKMLRMVVVRVLLMMLVLMVF